jgi:hypothetical protein
MISKLPSTCTAATFSIQAGNGLTDPPGEKKIQDLRTEVVENFCEKSVGHAVRKRRRRSDCRTCARAGMPDGSFKNQKFKFG